MPIFQYKALDSGGSQKSGIVDADTPRAARQKLREDGIHVTEIQSLHEQQKQAAARGLGFLQPKADTKELAVVTRQLATLIKAGITIVEALKALIEQVDTRDMERVLRDVRERVTQGDTLAEAMSAHPRFFNDLYVNMVRAGEASGQLDSILQRLATYVVGSPPR
jgi:general secretion pathway protein F